MIFSSNQVKKVSCQALERALGLRDMQSTAKLPPVSLGKDLFDRFPCSIDRINHLFVVLNMHLIK